MLYSKPLLLVAYLYFSYKSSILFILSQVSGIKMSYFLVRQKFISFLKHMYYTYVYKSFSTVLDKVSRKNIKRDGEVGKHKLNEMGVLNMK